MWSITFSSILLNQSIFQYQSFTAFCKHVLSCIHTGSNLLMVYCFEWWVPGSSYLCNNLMYLLPCVMSITRILWSHWKSPQSVALKLRKVYLRTDSLLINSDFSPVFTLNIHLKLLIVFDFLLSLISATLLVLRAQSFISLRFSFQFEIKRSKRFAQEYPNQQNSNVKCRCLCIVLLSWRFGFQIQQQQQQQPPTHRSDTKRWNHRPETAREYRAGKSKTLMYV